MCWGRGCLLLKHARVECVTGIGLSSITDDDEMRNVVGGRQHGQLLIICHSLRAGHVRLTMLSSPHSFHTRRPFAFLPCTTPFQAADVVHQNVVRLQSSGESVAAIRHCVSDNSSSIRHTSNKNLPGRVALCCLSLSNRAIKGEARCECEGHINRRSQNFVLGASWGHSVRGRRPRLEKKRS